MGRRALCATVIFHIRWRSTWYRSTSHALGLRFRIDRTCDFDAVARPSPRPHRNVRVLNRMRHSPHPWVMDTYRRILDCPGRSVSCVHGSWRPLGFSVVGNHRRSSRHVGTRFMVGGCPVVRVEAGRGSSSQSRLQIFVAADQKLYCSKGGLDLPHRSVRFSPSWGRREIVVRWTMLALMGLRETGEWRFKTMSPICIKHPRSTMTLGVCEQCLENIPTEALGEVLAAIHDEYELHCQLADRCRTSITVVNA
jgi:hypothetical protein